MQQFVQLGTPPPQPNNPTNQERYTMARYALTEVGRPEDFPYIIGLLSPPADITSIAPPGQFKGVKVGIIGGGLAGLSAAFELRKLGFDITVLEALQDRIGGRVYTYYFNREKTLYGEFGSMRIPVTHETVWHYINLFGLPTSPFIQRNENTFIYLHNVRVRNDPQGANVMKYIYPCYDLKPWERATPWQQLVYLGIDSHLLKAPPQIRSEVIQVKPEYNPITLFWDAQNILRMFRNAGLSEGAINIISSLSPLAGANLYNSYIDIAEANYPVNLSFLYEIPGGMVNLPLAFYKSFTAQDTSRVYPGISRQCLGKVSYKAGAWVKGIYNKGDGVVLTYENKEGKANQEAFDYVVCTIPFSSLRTVDINPLFSNMKMRAIREVNYIPSQKTIFLCKRRFWQEGGPDQQIIGGGSYTDLPISQIWYPSDHAVHCMKKSILAPYSHHYKSIIVPERMKASLASQPGVLIASYNYTLDTERLSNLTEKMKFEEIKREVEKVHGLPKGYLDTIVIDWRMIDWNKQPTIRGALCFFTPEQKRLFSYVMTIPEYDNRVFFAGDHISAVHRWMQGALKSGMDAANNLAEVCKARMLKGGGT